MSLLPGASNAKKGEMDDERIGFIPDGAFRHRRH
jgi:hypothetical protein